MQHAERRLDPLAILWVLACGCSWARITTERILELHEGLPRTGLVLLGFTLILASARWVPQRLRRNRLRYLPLLLLGLLALIEGHRHLLRRGYAASGPTRQVNASQSLWHPVTTTDLAVRYYTLRSAKLRAKRLRVVLLTDLHVTPALPRAYYEGLFQRVSEQDPDLILFSGDYASREANLELLQQVFARGVAARFGVFAVLGNHDYWTDAARIRTALESAGVTFVGDRCQHLPPAVGRIAICGTEAPWGPALSSALSRSDLNLVLSHTPDNIYRLAAQGASVVFAGHTHGGQIRLPGVGALVIPSRFGRLFDAGHFDVNGTHLFVSAGTGADAPSLRIYCPPELLVVDIKRE